MLVKQIAVFLENRQGRLNDLLLALSEKNINIQSLNIADTSDFGIVRMITSNNAAAKEVLKDAGFTSTETELVAVEVSDKPGSLSKTVDTVTKSGLNIEYIYSFTISEGKTLILFKTDDNGKAQEVLSVNKI